MIEVWSIAPQVVDDLVTGLRLEFVIVRGEPYLRISGDSLRYGNRQLEFAMNGGRTGAGMFVAKADERHRAWCDRVSKTKPAAGTGVGGDPAGCIEPDSEGSS